jgi:transcriptional regulator of NAD metabolism
MSVIMTFVAAGDPDELERRAAQNPDAMRSIAERAKENGLIAHRIYGADGKIMVVDEWPDPESFQRFFEQMRSEIEPMMQAVGATGEPEVTFWRKLDTHDDVGWES